MGIIPARAGFTPITPRRARTVGDHPRSRGVYAGSRRCRCHPWGSSPLARGLHATSVWVGVAQRIIPARAGFTRRRGSARGCRRDHPRSRGVYTQPLVLPVTNSGSSPLARGLRSMTASALSGPGIIPARAGFTGIMAPATSPTADHPRSRGVYLPASPPSNLQRGSSPLARGLPPRITTIQPPTRIIPARAGFTPWRRARSPPKRDHPRSRGVYH